MALLKTGIANSLTQGGVKTDIDWSDILALAIPALSADPNASQQALQGWQIGKAMRDARATRDEQLEAETQGRGLIGDILNAENARTQNIKSVMNKLPGIQAKPDFLPGAESTPFAVDDLINNAQAQVQLGDTSAGQIVNADTSNFEKIQELAGWSKEAETAQNPYDMAALIAKYPKAPISIAASLMTEHFGMKRKEAEMMLRASIDNAKEMRGYLQQEKLEGIKSQRRKEEIGLTGEEARKTEETKAELKPPKAPTPKMYEDIPVGDGTKIQTYKYNEKTGANDIPVGSPKPAWKASTADPEMKSIAKELAIERLNKLRSDNQLLENKMSPTDKAEYLKAIDAVKQAELAKATNPMTDEKKSDDLIAKYTAKANKLAQKYDKSPEVQSKPADPQFFKGVSFLKSSKDREEAKKKIKALSEAGWTRESLIKVAKEAGWE